MSKKFPKSFLWGAATSAHQVEGNNKNSDYWFLEQLENTGFGEPSGLACDHYQRFADDINIIAKLGLNSYRFSIEWARIEPRKGEFCPQALEHYLDMAKTCHKLGIKVIATYHHFSSPLWFAKEGGWENPDSVHYFVRYCRVVTEYLAGWLDYVCTINEPNLPLFLNYFKPELKPHFSQAQQVGAKAANSPNFAAIIFGDEQLQCKHMLEAHPLAVKAIKEILPKVQVGWTVLIEDHQYIGTTIKNSQAISQKLYLPFIEASKQDDFIGIQGYGRTMHDEHGIVPPDKNSELTLMGYEYYPQGIAGAVRFAHQHCSVPILITENGVAVSDDKRRENFINQALIAVQQCINDGIDVRGYMYWSLLDNFEFSLGYMPTFGLIAVDRETQQRTIKSSAYMFGKIAQNNALK